MTMYVLQRSESRSAHETTALYSFRGANSFCEWPREQGTGLGACGMWNFLWRLGFRPQNVTTATLPEAAHGDVLFAQLDAVAPDDALATIRPWIARGGALVVSGRPEGLAQLGCGTWRTVRPDHPYEALAYVRKDGRAQVMAPPSWMLGQCAAAPAETRRIGQVATVGGERQTPGRALVTPVPDAPAAIINGRACFLNGNVFAAFQAWLQGQEDLRPWFAWRHRLFWLDEWVSDIADLLSEAGVLDLGRPRPGIQFLGSTTIVLRHDLDYSRDTTYLDEESRRGIAATHAVLDDKNVAFWVERLAAAPSQVMGFHYSTGVRDWRATARRYLKGDRHSVWKVWRSGVAGLGLDRQVRRARSKGIAVATLHRHLPFVIYPEWIDALDAVLSAHDDVRGSSSLYRTQVLMWGSDRVDAFSAAIGEWPDSQFPLWLPFRLAHAAKHGRLLRGWESTSLMETEPELVAQMLDYRVPHLTQRVITLGFHPAHANKPTFNRGGSARQFNEVISLLAERHVDIRPLSEVYRLASQAAA